MHCGITFEWIKILASGVVGFVAASVVQLLFFHRQERTQKKLLRKSLYRELALTYIDLRELLPSLRPEGIDQHASNPAHLPNFVKADCFNTNKSSPVFWRLEDAFGIAQAHRNFGYLAVSKASDIAAAYSQVRQALYAFHGLIANATLSRHEFLESADGRVTEEELVVLKDGAK
jgi:hypothetical protein